MSSRKSSSPKSVGSPSMLTTAQVADRIGLSANGLRVRRMRGGGPPFIDLGGGTIRYPLASLELWMRERYRDPEADARRRAAVALALAPSE